MTPLRVLLAGPVETAFQAVSEQLTRLCHSVVGHCDLDALVRTLSSTRADLLVVDQAKADASSTLSRIVGLRAVSEVPILLLTGRPDPVLVDALVEWPATGLLYAPVDTRSLYAAIALAISAWERERLHRSELQAVRAMVGAMNGALLRTNDRGQIVESTPEAAGLLDAGAETLLGQSLEDVLGIPEPPAILAMRGAEPLVYRAGQPVRVQVLACSDDRDLNSGWLIRIVPVATEMRATAATEVSIPLQTEPPAPRQETVDLQGVMPPLPVNEYRPELRNVSLSVVARDVAARISSSISGRSFRVVVEPNMRASADDQLIRELLERLFTIARGATYGLPNGQVRFGQRVTRDRTVYYVFDNGRGDDPGRQEFLRDRLTDNGYGRVERIVGLHGGASGFKLDDVGRGATVFFTLPGRLAEPVAERALGAVASA